MIMIALAWCVMSCIPLQITGVPLYLPSILWHPKNYLFACNEYKNLTINVRMFDTINIVCPYKDSRWRTINRMSLYNPADVYEKISLVDEFEDYRTCNSSSSILFHLCNKPGEINIKKHKFAVVNDVKFQTGKTYYLISTSERTKESLNRTLNGSCLKSDGYFSLKLAIYVCTTKEIDNGTCNICNTSSCYETGCGRWGEWEETKAFVWNGTNCLQKFTRNCTSEYFKCNGPLAKFEIAPSNDNCSLYKIPCPTSRLSITTLSLRTAVATSNQTIKPITVYPSHCPSISYTATSIIKVTSTIYVTNDIGYDKKFYITVISAIICAVITSAFITHAFYYVGNRVRGKVHSNRDTRNNKDTQSYQGTRSNKDVDSNKDTGINRDTQSYRDTHSNGDTRSNKDTQSYREHGNKDSRSTSRKDFVDESDIYTTIV